MAKRIHFTAEDLARTRVVATIGVAAETMDGVRRLRERDGGLAFRSWRASVGAEFDGRLGEQARPLLALMPASGPQIDVASLTGDVTCIDEAVDRLLAAPRSLMRAELEYIDVHPDHRSWAGALADGDREARLQLAGALRACHRAAIAPYQQQVWSHLAAARAAYVRTMAEGGVERLLGTLCPPLVRWRPPVLEVRHPRSADIHLRGRGIVIAPTVFSSQQAEVLQDLLDLDRAPVLALPTIDGATDGPALRGADADTGSSLDDLLGRTRASVLTAAADGCTTTGLARRLNISPASASRHASVLRQANLITTRRDGKAVLHMITHLGAALLASAVRTP
ncbi:winged helix-turn-helix domain-containing protein [Streptomyces sp. NPDC002426]|uniref:Winged helix-turn-helix domain-containing protein n=1 Tax=Streptomyces sp. NBC_00148 TaxID=2903626 RepID=A0AAU1M1J1_9ACTN